MFFLKVLPVMYSVLAACSLLCTNQLEFLNFYKNAYYLEILCTVIV